MHPSVYIHSPVRLLLLMVGIIFLIELAVMMMLRHWGIVAWYSGILDAIVLTLLLVPAMFLIIVQPLKRQNEKIEADKARLHAIAEHIPDGLISINRHGIIQQANPALLQMFGYELDEIIGKNVSCLMPEPYRQEHDDYLRKFLRTGERHVIGYLREVEGCHKNGEIIDVELQVSHLSAGKYHLFIGLLRDISQRKKLDEERQAMRAHIEHAQRLESLGVLAGGVAHDFNNILTSIMGNASLAQMQAKNNPSICAMMQQIEHSSTRAAQLCKQMLAYAGKGRFVVQHCDISRVVQSMHALIRSSTPSNIEIELQLAEQLPSIEADESQLQQVIMNLCMNASEAIDGRPGGHIRITTGCVYLEGKGLTDYVGQSEQFKDTAKAGEYIFIRVEDNGGGIPPEIEKKIFEPFFTTHFTGRGLGLSACLGIVHSQNGLIKYHNHPGEGLSIEALFPVAPNHHHGDLSDLGCVLLAENDVSCLERITDMLNEFGLRCLTARNGEEALHLFHQHQQQIGLVILKMRLLKIGGVDTLRRIREQKPEVKAILMSSYDEAQGNSRLATQEGAHFLPKPVHSEKLRHILYNILMDHTTEW